MLTLDEQELVIKYVRKMLTTRGVHSLRVYRNSMSARQMKETAEKQLEELQELLKEIG